MESSSPSEFLRFGRRPKRRLAPADRTASPGFLRPFDACAPGAPFCRGLVTAGGEGRHAFAGAALGLVGPSAVSACPELRGLSTGPRASLGFSPSEVSPLEKPCRVAATLAPLRVQRRTSLRRGDRGFATGFHLAPAPGPTRPSTRGRTSDYGEGTRLPPTAGPTCQYARWPSHDSGLAGCSAVPPASKLCSSRESVRATAISRTCSRTSSRSTPRSILSWTLAPPELAAPRTRVRYSRRPPRVAKPAAATGRRCARSAPLSAAPLTLVPLR